MTLTYSDENVPLDRSLDYRHYQLFMKRMRKKLGPVRFFCAGEYGDVTLRPHFHAILFGVRFPDQTGLFNGSFRSTICEELWKMGDVHIGGVTSASASYVAGYATKRAMLARKRVLFDPGTGEIWDRRSEFVTMSRRPGIGSLWYDRFSGDVLPGDRAVSDGKCWKVPRYYVERFKREADAGVVEELLERRYQRAMEVPKVESSPERRAVREEVAQRRSSFYEERGL